MLLSRGNQIGLRPAPVLSVRISPQRSGYLSAMRGRPMHAINLLDQLRGLFAPKSRQESPVRLQRDELFDELLSTSPDEERVSELVDALADSGLQFLEEKLGGGPWQVCWSKGRPQLWRTTYEAGKAVAPRNVASQEFDTDGRLAFNKAEYLGDRVYVTASGTYVPEDDSTSMPKAIKVNIQRGSVHLFGLDVPLPIRGTGMFEVLYLDDELRIFRSRDSYAVQVRADVLADVAAQRAEQEKAE